MVSFILLLLSLGNICFFVGKQMRIAVMLIFFVLYDFKKESLKRDGVSLD